MRPEIIINLLLATLIGYLLYLVMVPFWVPVFWAVVLTILFYPPFTWFTDRLRLSRAFASALMCLLIAVFIIMPVWFVAGALVNELHGFYRWADTYLRAVSAEGEHAEILSYVQTYLSRYVEVSTKDIQNISMSILKEASSFLTKGLRVAITDLAALALNFIFTFFAMYYLFKDGDALLAKISGLLPLDSDAREEIFRKNRDIISSTLYGGVLVSALQGIIGGLTFWALGLSSPVLWGFFMLIFAFLPVVGPSVIWGPAAIYFFVQGSYVKGVVLVVMGLMLAVLLDNILRPLIVSGKTKMNPVLLLFSILGAMSVFGFIGIIAGPIILSIAMAMIDIYQESVSARGAASG